MKRNTNFRHWLEALLIWALPYALRPLPFGLRVRAGGVLVGGIVRWVPSLKKRITDNLLLIYPGMEKPEMAVLVKDITTNIGERFIEAFYNHEFHHSYQGIHYEPGAFEPIVAAQNAGQPVIVVSGHFGQWEAIRIILARKGYPSAAIYKESSNPFFERRFKETMSVDGVPLFPVGPTGTRQMIKHLKSGGMVSVLLDQRVKDGEAIDFMGKPAPSSTIMAALAIKYNALIVPVYAVLRPDRRACDIHIEAPLKHSDPLEMTTLINDSLSARVYANPEQWYWLHRRWGRKLPQ
ncbi:MAG: lysophospholipid acyltransferase family protein [Rhodobacteraceae bacterium]|nr:lysophospholipid acyltransferase family protein [Paracoccaceae bacterium]